MADVCVIASQANALDNRTLSLPLLYISGKLDPEKVSSRANKATHRLTFRAPLPPVGFSTFLVKKSAVVKEEAAAVVAPVGDTISNGVYTVKIDQAAGLIESVTNEKTGASIPLNITWG